nr:HAMP domain-containing protein [Allochromatium palmeri]
MITLVTIIRPLRQLTRHADDIAKGYWHFIQSCDTSAQRQDEFGILIRTFNLMIETIRATHQELKDANACLEQKVSERTRELEEKNRQLERPSSTDGLTQISNRVKLDEQFQEQLQDAMVERADQALYWAKSEGRNRVLA